MAQISRIPTRSLDISGLVKSFQVSQQTLAQTQKSIQNISQVLINRTKVRKQYFSTISESKRKRDISTLRSERESELEAKKVVLGSLTNVTNAVSSAGGSLLGRILKALAFLAAGWLLKYVPRWIGYAKEFIARITKLGEIIKSFVGNITGIFESTGRLLTGIKDNLLNFDLFDSEKKVSTAFNELRTSIDGVGKNFEEAINVFTTDFTKQVDGVEVGTYSEEAIPPEGGYQSAGRGIYSPGKVPEKVKSDTAFTQGVTELAKKYKIPEDYLYAVMGFETGGTYDPGKKNMKGSGATGLIQFMPSTAEGLGTSTSELSKMSRAEQLKYVDKYFSGKGIEGGSLSDVYMAVLFPAAVGKPDDYVLFGKGARSGYTGIAYQQNKGLDLNKDGSVTKAEASAKVKEYLPKDFTEPRADSSQPSPGKITSTGTTTNTSNLKPGDKVSGYEVTSSYGPRWGRTHGGVDIGTPVGTYISLGVPVEILFSGLHGSPGRGYGNVIDAWAPSLGLQFRMAHLQSLIAKKGQKLAAGEVLGRTGGAPGDRGAGSSTGPHVHFEVDNVKGRGDYGGMGNPSAYAKFLLLSSKPTKATTEKTEVSPKPIPTKTSPAPAAPEVKPTPSTTPQISAAPTQQKQQAVAQQLVPERKGQDVSVVIPPPQQQQPMQQSAAPPKQQSAPSIGDLLNRFMKQKLLLDLSFL